MPKIYAYDGMSFLNLRFENDVKKYGIQAKLRRKVSEEQFENDVKKYGIQANSFSAQYLVTFENDVKKYGIQAKIR